MPRRLTDVERELRTLLKLSENLNRQTRATERAEKAARRAAEKEAERAARLPRHIAIALTKFRNLYARLKWAQGVIAAATVAGTSRWSYEVTQADLALSLHTSTLAFLIRDHTSLLANELPAGLIEWSMLYLMPTRRTPAPLPQL